MRLVELARGAGLWVETVQLFVQRGMLPPPNAEGGYGEQHLAVARFISRVQAQYHLSLETVRAVLLASPPFDLERSEAAIAGLAEPNPAMAGPGPTRRAGLVERTGASAGLVEALVGASLLPARGPYAGHHVWTVEAAVALEAAGMARDSVLRIGALGLEIAEAEVAALIDDVGVRPPRTAIAGVAARRMAVGHLVSVARHGSSGELLSRLAQASDGSKQLILHRVHVPSRLFLARYRLEEVLAELRAEASAIRSALTSDGPRLLSVGPLLEHSRLLVGLGRFAEATPGLALAASHVSGQRDPVVWAYLGLCRAMLGDDKEAQRASERAVALKPERAIAHSLRAVVSAILAGRAGGLLQATARIREALAAVEASRACVPAVGVERLEAALSRGRLCTVLPEAFGVRAAGIADLESVLEATADETDASLGFDVAGSRDLVRLNALFFLGIALDEAGRTAEAEPLLSEVVSLDPVSRYATLAYQRLQR